MFKRWTKDTLDTNGSYSFVRRGTQRGRVWYFTPSETKMMWLQELGLTFGRPEKVTVGIKDYETNVVTPKEFYRCEVQKLSPVSDDKHLIAHTVLGGLDDATVDEIEWYRTHPLAYSDGKMTVADWQWFIKKHTIARMPRIWEAMQFIMAEFPPETVVCDDMHNENWLLDKTTGDVIAYDIFNLEQMEQSR